MTPTQRSAPGTHRSIFDHTKPLIERDRQDGSVTLAIKPDGAAFLKIVRGSALLGSCSAVQCRPS